MATVTGAVTFAEFEQLPDIPGKRELLNGEVIDLPPAKRIHIAIVVALANRLLHLLPENRVWVEGGYRIGEGYLIPDVSVSHPDQPVDNDYLQRAPMLAIEVASGGNTPEQLDSKVTLYLQNGGQEVWVVYPKNRHMMVFHASGAIERVTGAWTSPATGLTFDIAELIVTRLNELH